MLLGFDTVHIVQYDPVHLYHVAVDSANLIYGANMLLALFCLNADVLLCIKGEKHEILFWILK